MGPAATLFIVTLLATSAPADPVTSDQVRHSVRSPKGVGSTRSCSLRTSAAGPQAPVNAGPNGNDPLCNGCDPMHQASPSCAGTGGGSARQLSMRE